MYQHWLYNGVSGGDTDGRSNIGRGGGGTGSVHSMCFGFWYLASDVGSFAFVDNAALHAQARNAMWFVWRLGGRPCVDTISRALLDVGRVATAGCVFTPICVR